MRRREHFCYPNVASYCAVKTNLYKPLSLCPQRRVSVRKAPAYDEMACSV